MSTEAALESPSAPRWAAVTRKTAEVEVSVELRLDGQGRTDVHTGLPFVDHMLSQLAKHARFDLTLRADGDLEVDAHHTVEDTGIALGQALGQALGDKSGVRRFGDATVPLDEARARVAVDLSGRPYLIWDVDVVPTPGELGGVHPRQLQHLLEGMVVQAACTVHVLLEAGELPHHCLEACFKALARALGDACAPDARAGSGSTKGQLG